MDRAAWLQQRRRRYLAQILSEFEEKIEPMIAVIPAGDIPAIRDFKGLVRGRLNALAVDAIDIFTKTERGVEINAHAQQLRDQLGSTGKGR